jgi:hypothetical protein
MRRIRERLTYANVMATIAVFLVLGGGAYAASHLPRNSVRSKNIVNGAVKLADTSSKLRLKCPRLTRYHEGACIEASIRPETNDWSDAASDCADEGRRLPTVAELSTFRFEPGITLGAGGGQEWALEHDENSANAWTVSKTAYTVSIASNDEPYRCVARPKR